MIKRAGRYFDHALIAAFSNDKLKTFRQAGGLCRQKREKREDFGPQNIKLEKTKITGLISS